MPYLSKASVITCHQLALSHFEKIKFLLHVWAGSELRIPCLYRIKFLPNPKLLLGIVLCRVPAQLWLWVIASGPLLTSVATVEDLLVIRFLIFELIGVSWLFFLLLNAAQTKLLCTALYFHTFTVPHSYPWLLFHFISCFLIQVYSLLSSPCLPQANYRLSLPFLWGVLALHCLHPFCIFISPADSHCPSTPLYLVSCVL